MVKWFIEDQRRTWFGHGLVAVVVSLIPALWDYPLITGAIPVLAFYLLREQQDEERHRDIGDYDEPEPRSRVTPRVDKVGDLVGPACVCLMAIAVDLMRYLVWCNS